MKSSRRKTRAKRALPGAAGPEQILELFANDLAIRIVQVLDRGPRLYDELRHEFKSARQSSFGQTMRDLQEAGLVWRKAYPTSAARVEYSLTSLGKSFIAPLQVFCEWAYVHERELSAVSARRAKKSTRTGNKDHTRAKAQPKAKKRN
jgi:DNA-binding HxlR family transcriptional regulator